MRCLNRGLVAAAIALLLGACSGPTEILLSADRATISAGGLDFALITARTRLAGDPVKAGTKISFDTTAGSFAQGTQQTTQDAATDDSGEAQIKLYSGPSEGSATVTATFYDDESGLSATSSISITFGAPSGANLPVDGTFRLTCDAVNIGALREPVPQIQVTCKISAQNRTGETIPSTALTPTFFTEAGGITPKTDPYTDELVYIYSPSGGASAPKDVTPMQTLNEPSRSDGSGRTRNPRDGLVTIVAVVDGEEAFLDPNGNGQYDQGEEFTDSAEPFIDLNDNDQRDADEKYVDTNTNSAWDKANGQWDASTKIMAIYKILWTGELDNAPDTSRIDRMSSTIADGGKLELTAFALDANMNPVAAFQENQDYIEWILNSGGDAYSYDDSAPPMTNAYGFEFDKAAKTERKRWNLVSNSFSAKSYSFTVEDGYPGDEDPPTSFTVSVKVNVTPGPGPDEYFLDQRIEVIEDKVQGTCD